MFVLVKLLVTNEQKPKGYLQNSIKDVCDFVLSVTGKTSEAERAGLIASNMKFGEVFETLQYRIRCVDDALVWTKIWVGMGAAPDGFYKANTINKAKNCIIFQENNDIVVDEIKVNYIGQAEQADGGDVVDFFHWLRISKRNYNTRLYARENVADVIPEFYGKKPATTRNANVICGRSGGSASGEALTFKIALPTAWMRSMGIHKENRAVVMEYDETEQQITIIPRRHHNDF